MCSGSWPDEPKLGGDPRWCKSRESRGRSRGIGVEMSVLHSCAAARPQKAGTSGDTWFTQARRLTETRARRPARTDLHIIVCSRIPADRHPGRKAPVAPEMPATGGRTGRERTAFREVSRAVAASGDLPAAPAQRPRRGLAVLLQKPCLLAVPVALRGGFAFVGELLAASKTDLQLRDAAMIEVEDQRDDGHALALRRVPELR